MKEIIGSVEWCALPELGIDHIKSRIDTGASISALHATNIHISRDEGGVDMVHFDVFPLQKDRKTIVHCTAPLVAKRDIKSSNGISETRCIIKTSLQLGSVTKDITLSLTDRDSMSYRMLIGRRAISKCFIVDTSSTFVHGIFVSKTTSHHVHIHSYEKQLQLGLLATNPHLYSNRRIMEEAQKHGHTIDFLKIDHCYCDINSPEPRVLQRGKEIPLDGYDAIIPRIRPQQTYYGLSIIRQFKTKKVFILNDDEAILKSRDKLHSLQILAEKKVPIPHTGFAFSPVETRELIRMVGGAPLIVKLLEGTQGKGVVLAETNKAAESVIKAFKSVNQNIIVQEFIEESRGTDIRCFVVDGKVVASMKRVAVQGEFRANVHLGGTALPVKITHAERKLAIRAAQVLGLKVAGVDIIRSYKGPLVLEVNSSPGLEGIEGANNANIAQYLIQSIEKHLK